VFWVPAFTGLKLHDFGPDDPNAEVEVLDMQQPAGSELFFAGNRKFLTKKLWGAANFLPSQPHLSRSCERNESQHDHDHQRARAFARKIATLTKRNPLRRTSWT
jgi:hypothetical protein